MNPTFSTVDIESPPQEEQVITSEINKSNKKVIIYKIIIYTVIILVIGGIATTIVWFAFVDNSSSLSPLPSPTGSHNQGIPQLNAGIHG